MVGTIQRLNVTAEPEEEEVEEIRGSLEAKTQGSFTSEQEG